MGSVKITEEMVDYVSLLSRLKLPAEEKAAVAEELGKIVSYMDVLSTLDTQGVEAMSHAVPLKNVLRPDVVEPSSPREELLKGSPTGDSQAFLVPKAVE